MLDHLTDAELRQLIATLSDQLLSATELLGMRLDAQRAELRALRRPPDPKRLAN